MVKSPGHRCAKVIARLVNLLACSDFDSLIGAIWAMSRLISIFKINHDDEIGPIFSFSSLRRPLARA